MISLATALYASTCPPEGWEKADGNGGWTPAVWPPTASTYCISPYGWQGTEETNHCAGGTNALDDCCEFIGGSERLRCEPCTVPPARSAPDESVPRAISGTLRCRRRHMIAEGWA